MKKWCLPLAVLAFWTAPLCADFRSGLEAYNRGDFATAMREWQPLAEKGDANCQYNLGLLYARGQGVPEDLPKAVEWYRKAAGQGVAAAQYNLGVIYANGQGGVPQNLPEARQWFEKAAGRQVPEAEDGLGYFYGQGQGVAKDFAAAGRWYRKAADAGVAGAQYNLGVMYDLGQGVERNFSEALQWYRKAADQRYPPALCNIGILYYNAQGVERDLAQSYAWFKRCEEAGDPRGGQLRGIVESRIKPEDLQRATRLAGEWRPSGPQYTPDLERLFVKTAPAVQTAAVAERQAPDAPPPAAAPPAAPAPEAGSTAAAATAPPEPAHPAATPAAEVLSAAAEPPGSAREPEAGPAAGRDSHPAAPVQSLWAGVDRIVAVGDVLGDFEQFFTVLESAGLVDGAGDWAGGTTHLVQTGNIIGSGPDSGRVMDLLMRLEKQAAAAGGGVHCLIGANEAKGVADSVYAPWIRGHNAVIQIDNTLFVHAGIGARYADWDRDRINEAVRAQLSRGGNPPGGVAADPEGPLAFTGLAGCDETAAVSLVDRLLGSFGVRRIVAGHAYTGGAVMPRFGGKVILVNTGLSRVLDSRGALACLVIERGKPMALHRGQKLELPNGGPGGLLRYLKEAAALDPRPSPLLPRIADLERLERSGTIVPASAGTRP